MTALLPDADWRHRPGLTGLLGVLGALMAIPVAASVMLLLKDVFIVRQDRA